MTLTTLFLLLGVLFGASLGCVALEQAVAIHPTVRRAAQAFICILAGIYVGRFFGLLPL